MAKAAPSAILFDLGGVLLPFDREQRIATIVERLSCTAEAASAFMATDIHQRLDTGEANEFDLAAAFSAYFGRHVSPVAAVDLVLSVFQEPNHELWELADALRAHAVVGGFSDNPAFVDAVFPMDAFLDPMFFSGRMGACKPSAAAFAAVEAGLAMPPAAILFIDDTPANVAAALARGWDAIHFRANDQLRGELAKRGLP